MSTDTAKTRKLDAMTHQIMAGVRESTKLFEELTKHASKYEQHMLAVVQTGRQMAEIVARIRETQAGGDIGDGLTLLATCMLSIENKRLETARAIEQQLIEPIRGRLESDKANASQFERLYRKERDKMKHEIVAAEKRTRKTKKPEMLQVHLKELNDLIKDDEAMRMNKLREAILFHREKYCHFVGVLNTILRSHKDVSNSSVQIISANEPMFHSLAEAAEKIPKDKEELVALQERTFVQIQSSPEDHAHTVEDEPAESHAPPTLSLPPMAPSMPAPSIPAAPEPPAASIPTPPPLPMMGTPKKIPGALDEAAPAPSLPPRNEAPVQKCRALYDYSSDEPEDLQFKKGSIITVTQADDGSGWTEGTLKKKTGIFPTSYVEMI